MKIALGTTSKQKLKILELALLNLKIDKEDFKISPIEVPSEIPEQPLEEKVTIIGALNRARNALKSSSIEDIGIGLEGGLEEVHGIYQLVCVAVIIDREGSKYIGISKKMILPKKVSDEIKKGGQFGELIREYESLISDQEEFLKKHINQLISREGGFQEAIEQAFGQLLSKKHYVVIQ